MTTEDVGWRFANDVLRPWRDLDDLLSTPLSMDPARSDASRMAGSLAISIKHQADHLFSGDETKVRKFVDGPMQKNEAARLMSDFADKAKHVDLKNEKRDVTSFVQAVFEYDEARGYRFIQHRFVAQHVRMGDRDFMVESAAAIDFWANLQGLALPAPLTQSIAPERWLPYAGLVFDPKRTVRVKAMRLMLVKRNAANELVPTDVPVNFVVFDMEGPEAKSILGTA